MEEIVTETKWTPGPWHWDSDPVQNDPYNRVRYRVVTKGKTITQVYYSSYEGGPTNAEADAKLIAAAPDLYEALKRARNSLATAIQANVEAPDFNVNDHVVIKQIDAALVKARGEQP